MTLHTHHAVTLAVHFLLLTLAAHAVTRNALKDWMPFGGFRIWLWKRCPYPNMVAPGGPWDPNDPEDWDRFRPTWRNRVGYLWTCPHCLGFWVSLILGIAYLLAPVGTIHVALILAIWAAQQRLTTRWE